MGESASSSLTSATTPNTSASIDYNNSSQFRRANILNSSNSSNTSSNNRAITSASVNPEYLSRT
jgi:hypothetical protein